MPYTVRVRPYLAGQEDAHGNPITGHGEPREWQVRSVAPGPTEEPRKPNRDLSVVEWTIYAPKGDEPGHRDQVSLPWEDDPTDGPIWYDIEGKPRDWSRGPWPSPNPSVVVELRRPEG